MERPDVQFNGAEPLAFDGRRDEVRRRSKQLGDSGQKKSAKEKEDEQKLEKARAAAWAWYEHGKGGKESVSSNIASSTGAASMPSNVRSSMDDSVQKSSRFKKEALKTSSESRTKELDRARGETGHRRTGSGWSWDFSNESEIVVSPTSSLFDSFELNSMSKRIDTAFLGPKSTRTTGPPSRRSSIVPHGEGPSQSKPAIGLPRPARPPGASALHVPQGVTTSSHGATLHREVVSRQGFSTAVDNSLVLTSSPEVSRSSSHRWKFSCCSSSSISDVITQEEVSHRLGIDITKYNGEMTPVGDQSDGSCVDLHRVMKSLQEFMHIPEFDYHPQRQHHERHHHRHLHLHRLHLHRLHRSRDQEYNHHLNYQIKLKDGVLHVRRVLGFT